MECWMLTYQYEVDPALSWLCLEEVPFQLYFVFVTVAWKFMENVDKRQSHIRNEASKKLFLRQLANAK